MGLKRPSIPDQFLLIKIPTAPAYPAVRARNAAAAAGVTGIRFCSSGVMIRPAANHRMVLVIRNNFGGNLYRSVFSEN